MSPHLNVRDVFEIIKNIAQTLAWLIGAVWVVMNYRLDRTHVPRVQVYLDAKIDNDHLVVIVTVKNPGRSLVTITKKGTALLILRSKDLDAATDVTSPEWEPIHALALFESGRLSWENKVIEPGLVLREENLIALPRRHEVYLIRLMVTVPPKEAPDTPEIWSEFFPQNWPNVERIWSTAKVVEHSPKSDSLAQASGGTGNG